MNNIDNDAAEEKERAIAAPTILSACLLSIIVLLTTVLYIIVLVEYPTVKIEIFTFVISQLRNEVLPGEGIFRQEP